MGKRKRWMVIAAVILVLVASQLACATTLPAAVRGGGWIPVGEGKATFGFQLTCDAETGQAKGQFQYKDHSENTAFHGVLDTTINIDGYEPCEIPGEDIAFEGDYRPQPKKLGDGGTFTMTLLGGSEKDQCLRIELEDGIHDGYVREGCLGGGNIKVWDQEE